jgi:hypothetical protein
MISLLQDRELLSCQEEEDEEVAALVEVSVANLLSCRHERNKRIAQQDFTV